MNRREFNALSRICFPFLSNFFPLFLSPRLAGSLRVLYQNLDVDLVISCMLLMSPQLGWKLLQIVAYALRKVAYSLCVKRGSMVGD